MKLKSDLADLNRKVSSVDLTENKEGIGGNVTYGLGYLIFRRFGSK